MNITNKILTGKVPITEQELRYACENYRKYDLTKLNTGEVEDMSYLFDHATDFNQKIGGWNIGKVRSTHFMFNYATNFNQDIRNWNTENIEDMDGMFYEAEKFNQYIGGWNTRKVAYMYCMFHGAISFNQNISSWDITLVNNIGGSVLMFSDCPIEDNNKPKFLKSE